MKNSDARNPRQAPLSSTSAFVIHIVDRSADSLCGRIEHVVSGRSAYFASVGEMLEAMFRTLDAVDQQIDPLNV